MNYQQLTGKTIRQGFNEFNSQNPHIYRAFEEQALKAIKAGATKISAKLIINYIRWNEFLRTTDQNFRINDAYQSYYAREFTKRHPAYKDVFNFRKLRNEVNGPYMIEKNGQLAFM